jgi:chaperonin cofactor prefoldin
MAKRRKNDGGGVSLFPFMSILACLIGILTLMISVSMKAKEMDQEERTEEEMARAIANRELKKKIEEVTKEKENLEDRLKEEKSTAAEMAKLEDHKIVLKTKLDEIQTAQNPDETDAALQKIIENLRQEITLLKQERPPLSKQLTALQEELKKRKEPPKVVESVIIRPGGIGSREARNLFFVECTSTGIILQSDDGLSKPISTATIETNEDFNNPLEKVKRTRDSMVLFLIRKGGNQAYLWAAGLAETKYKLNTGKLPIPNEGQIDLSLFK